MFHHSARSTEARPPKTRCADRQQVLARAAAAGGECSVVMLLRLLRLARRSHRSLRDLCYTLVILAGASAILTYHISRHLPSRRDHPLQRSVANTADDDDDDEYTPDAVDIVDGVEHRVRRRSAGTEWRRTMPPDDNEVEADTTMAAAAAAVAATVPADEARIVLEGLESDRRLVDGRSTVVAGGTEDDVGDKPDVRDNEDGDDGVEEDEDGDGDGVKEEDDHELVSTRSHVVMIGRLFLLSVRAIASSVCLLYATRLHCTAAKRQ